MCWAHLHEYRIFLIIIFAHNRQRADPLGLGLPHNGMRIWDCPLADVLAIDRDEAVPSRCHWWDHMCLGASAQSRQQRSCPPQYPIRSTSRSSFLPSINIKIKIKLLAINQQQDPISQDQDQDTLGERFMFCLADGSSFRHTHTSTTTLKPESRLPGDTWLWEGVLCLCVSQGRFMWNCLCMYRTSLPTPPWVVGAGRSTSLWNV